MPPKPKAQSTEIDPKEFYLSEYASLREEMLKRIELQHQIITLALVAVGTFITIGTHPNSDALILLIYPIFASFLAVGWYQHNLRIKRIGDYIREKIESKVLAGGWEQHRTNITAKIKVSATVISASGTFAGTQLLTIVLAIPKLVFSEIELWLLLADGLAIVLTILAVRRRPLM